MSANCDPVARLLDDAERDEDAIVWHGSEVAVFTSRTGSRTGPPRYGPAHRRLRRRWARDVATGTVQCARCGQPIAPGDRWDLDHAPDGGYLGPSHAACNRATSSHRPPRRRPDEQHPGTRGRTPSDPP